MLTLIENQVKDQQEIVETIGKTLNAVRLEVQTICNGIYLATRLDVFSEVKQSLLEYQKLLISLQLKHQTYLNKLSLIQGEKGYAQEIEAHMDEILYDKGQVERQCREMKTQRDVVLNQLSLTDYEEIKHQLDLCLTRLSKLPFEIEKSVEESTSLRKDLEQLKKNQEKKKEDYDRQRGIVEFLKETFYMEAKQGLVILDIEPEGKTEEWIKQLSDRVCKIYREIAERRTQNDAFALIQENFQKNKVYLHEYFPTIHTVFDDVSVPESLGEFQVKRINITGKYRGVTIEFKKLVNKLASDVEEQARLLSDRDHESVDGIYADIQRVKIKS